MSDKLVQVEHLQQYFPAGGYGKNKKYIYFKKLVSTVDPDILKAYMETILDSIYTADGKITALTFKNGLTHRFIDKDK